MSRNVQIDIKSMFDASGFTKAEAAVNTLKNSLGGLTKAFNGQISLDAKTTKSLNDLTNAMKALAQSHKDSVAAVQQAAQANQQLAQTTHTVTQSAQQQANAVKQQTASLKGLYDVMALAGRAGSTLLGTVEKQSASQRTLQQANDQLASSTQRLQTAQNMYDAALKDGTATEEQKRNAAKELVLAQNELTKAQTAYRSIEEASIKGAQQYANALREKKTLETEIANIQANNLKVPAQLQTAYDKVVDSIRRYDAEQQHRLSVDTQVQAKMQELVQAQTRLNAANTTINAGMKELVKNQEQVASRFEPMVNGLQKIISWFQKFASVISSVIPSASQGMRALGSAIGTLATSGASNFARLQSALSRAGSAFGSFSKSAGQSLGLVNKGIVDTAAGWSLLTSGRMLSGFGGKALGGMGLFSSDYLDYEKAVTQTAISSDAPFNLINQLVRGIHENSYGAGQAMNISPVDIAKGAYFITSATGITLDQSNIGAFARYLIPILQTASYTGATAEQMVKGSLNVSSEFGYNPRDFYKLDPSTGGDYAQTYKGITALIGFLANKGEMEVTDVIETFKQVGPLLNVASGGKPGDGLSDLYTATYLAAESGLKGSRVGTGIAMLVKTALSPSGPAIQAAATAFKNEGFGEATIDNWRKFFFEADGKTLKGGLGGFLDKFKDVNEQSAISVLSGIFPANALRNVVGIIQGQRRGESGSSWDDIKAMLNSDDAIAFLEQATEKANNTIGAHLTNLHGAWTTTNAAIVQSIKGMVIPALDQLAAIIFKIGEIIDKNPIIGKFVASLLGIVGVVASVVGTFLTMAGALLLLQRGLMMTHGSLTLITGIFGAIPSLLLSILPIMLLLGAAGVILYNAWQKNFLGIRGFIEHFTTDFDAAFNYYIIPILNKAAAYVSLLAQRFLDASTVLAGWFANAVGWALQFQQVLRGFAEGVGIGIVSAVASAIAAFRLLFDAVRQVVDRLSAFALSGALDAWANKARIFGEVVGAAIGVKLVTSLVRAIPFVNQLSIQFEHLVLMSARVVAALLAFVFTLNPILGLITLVVGGILAYTAATEGMSAVVEKIKEFVTGFVTVLYIAYQIISQLIAPVVDLASQLTGLSNSMYLLGAAAGLVVTWIGVSMVAALGQAVIGVFAFSGSIVGDLLTALAGLTLGVAAAIIKLGIFTLAMGAQAVEAVATAVIGLIAYTAQIAGMAVATGAAIIVVAGLVLGLIALGGAFAAVGLAISKINLGDIVSSLGSEMDRIFSIMQSPDRWEILGNVLSLQVRTMMNRVYKTFIDSLNQTVSSFLIKAATASSPWKAAMNAIYGLTLEGGIMVSPFGNADTTKIQESIDQSNMLIKGWTEYANLTAKGATFENTPALRQLHDTLMLGNDFGVDTTLKYHAAEFQKVLDGSLSASIKDSGMEQTQKSLKDELLSVLNWDDLKSYLKQTGQKLGMNDWLKLVGLDMDHLDLEHLDLTKLFDTLTGGKGTPAGLEKFKALMSTTTKDLVQQVKDWKQYQELIKSLHGDIRAANEYYTSNGMKVPTPPSPEAWTAYGNAVDEALQKVEADRVAFEGALHQFNQDMEGMISSLKLPDVMNIVSKRQGLGQKDLGDLFAGQQEALDKWLSDYKYGSGSLSNTQDLLTHATGTFIGQSLAGVDIAEAMANDPGIQHWAAELGVYLPDFIAEVIKNNGGSHFVFDSRLLPAATLDLNAWIAKMKIKGRDATIQKLNDVFDINWDELMKYAASQGTKNWNLADFFAEQWKMSKADVEQILKDHGVDPKLLSQATFPDIQDQLNSDFGKFNVLTADMYQKFLDLTHGAVGNIIKMTQADWLNLPNSIKAALTAGGYTVVLDEINKQHDGWQKAYGKEIEPPKFKMPVFDNGNGGGTGAPNNSPWAGLPDFNNPGSGSGSITSWPLDANGNPIRFNDSMPYSQILERDGDPATALADWMEQRKRDMERASKAATDAKAIAGGTDWNFLPDFSNPGSGGNGAFAFPVGPDGKEIRYKDSMTFKQILERDGTPEAAIADWWAQVKRDRERAAKTAQEANAVKVPTYTPPSSVSGTSSGSGANGSGSSTTRPTLPSGAPAPQVPPQIATVMDPTGKQLADSLTTAFVNQLTGKDGIMAALEKALQPSVLPAAPGTSTSGPYDSLAKGWAVAATKAFMDELTGANGITAQLNKALNPKNTNAGAGAGADTANGGYGGIFDSQFKDYGISAVQAFKTSVQNGLSNLKFSLPEITIGQEPQAKGLATGAGIPMPESTNATGIKIKVTPDTTDFQQTLSTALVNFQSAGSAKVKISPDFNTTVLSEQISMYGMDPSATHKVKIGADITGYLNDINPVIVSYTRISTVTAGPKITAYTADYFNAVNWVVLSYTALNAATPTVHVYVSDYASSTLSNISYQMDLLNGKTSTVYVATVSYDAGRNTVPGYASGGTVWDSVVRVNEEGQELGRLPSGNLVALPMGTEVYPHQKSVAMLDSFDRKSAQSTTVNAASTNQTVIKIENVYVRSEQDINKLADKIDYLSGRRQQAAERTRPVAFDRLNAPN